MQLIQKQLSINFHFLDKEIYQRFNYFSWSKSYDVINFLDVTKEDGAESNKHILTIVDGVKTISQKDKKQKFKRRRSA